MKSKAVKGVALALMLIALVGGCGGEESKESSPQTTIEETTTESTTERTSQERTTREETTVNEAAPSVVEDQAPEPPSLPGPELELDPGVASVGGPAAVPQPAIPNTCHADPSTCYPGGTEEDVEEAYRQSQGIPEPPPREPSPWVQGQIEWANSTPEEKAAIREENLRKRAAGEPVTP